MRNEQINLSINLDRPYAALLLKDASEEANDASNSQDPALEENDSLSPTTDDLIIAGHNASPSLNDTNRPRSAMGPLSSSLASTPEEDCETDEGNGSISDSAGEDSSLDHTRREAHHRRRGRRNETQDDVYSTCSSSSSDNGGENDGQFLNSSTRTGLAGGGGGGRQMGHVEGLPDPAIMDWEVAVVKSSRNADDMVRCPLRSR